MTNTDTDGDKYVINGVEVTPVEAIEIITAFFKKQQFCVGKLKARIAELEEKQRWIPVSERLPFGEKVLVLWKDRTIHLDWTFLDGGGYYWWNSGQSNVTHWMPLPEPPEVQE